MLTRTKAFSLTIAALLVLTPAVGARPTAMQEQTPKPSASNDTVGHQAQGPIFPPESKPHTLIAPSPAPDEPNPLLEATRRGAFPSQLAGHSGAIRPDRHGPQRNDPAEGIPAHAYSPFDERRNQEHPCPPGGCDFAAGQVVVKLAPSIGVRGLNSPGNWTASPSLNKTLSAQGVLRLEPVFPAAKPPRSGEMVVSPNGEWLPKPDLTRWHRAILPDTADIYAVVEALSADPAVEYAEPDYFRKPVGGPSAPVSLSPPLLVSLSPQALPGPGTDPLYDDQWHLDAANVPAAWQWLEDNGYAPGGSRDIVVAVIDTGIDYTHPDLSANMWVNSAEFSGDPGVDDDGNGYVDDIHGADAVYPDGDPRDDHGHGTHVAGIIAAQTNNGEGGVGVAYNVQLMALKAAQYSGVLASSDIAEAIYYAVDKGADVINMSFGGYARSQVEEDALAVAFGQAVLVAAAGNDGKVNLPCLFGRDMYPAAYNWVLGVMASTQSGSRASFSNYDCTSHTSYEYELMAPGIDVWSTLPNENYAAWDGTSMSAPVVSGIAALLRTRWYTKTVYSSRFIMGQIASNASPMADAYTALTVAPEPKLSYLEHWLFDTEEQSPDNDDDGIVDAGETVDLAIVIHNHWGKADVVTVTLEAWAEGAVQPDPYVTMITDTVSYGAIGSFNVDDNGLIYENDVVVGVEHPFRFTVPITTPNDHVIPFRLTMACRNGLDPSDTTTYTFESRFYLIVQRGRELPIIISQDMVLTKDYYWLVPDQTLIEAGVTVTVTPGTQLQFYTAIPDSPHTDEPYARIGGPGAINLLGTQSEPIEMFLSNDYAMRIVKVENADTVHYTRIQNPSLKAANIVEHLDATGTGIYQWNFEWNGQIIYIGAKHFVNAPLIHSSIFKGLGPTLNGGSPYAGGPFRFSEELGLADTIVEESLLEDNFFYHSLRDSSSSRFKHNVVMPNYRVHNDEQIRSSRIWVASDQQIDCSNAHAVSNNAFINDYFDDIEKWFRIQYYKFDINDTLAFCITDNYWGTTNPTVIEAVLIDRYDDFELEKITYTPPLTTPLEIIYPFVQ